MKAKVFSFFRKVSTTLRRVFKNISAKIAKYIDNFCIARVKNMPDYKLMVCKTEVSVSDAETQATPTKIDDDFDWNIVCDVV